MKSSIFVISALVASTQGLEDEGAAAVRTGGTEPYFDDDTQYQDAAIKDFIEVNKKKVEALSPVAPPAAPIAKPIEPKKQPKAEKKEEPKKPDAKP